MRTVKLYRHGATMGTPPTNPNRKPPKRGKVQGWSISATRRNIQFLRSVVTETLNVDQDGQWLYGHTFTLTLRECPPDPQEWHRLRTALVKRLRRQGLVRLHWVTEWQRRGVPHLHGVAFSPNQNFGQWIIGHWCSVAAEYGALPRAQHTLEVFDFTGWAKYLAKHAARGVNHYQRSQESVPPEWQGNTGRVWGHVGDWEITDPDKVAVDSSTYYRLRRLVRSWRKSDARDSGCRFRIRSARTMLKANERALSEIRGISEWIPHDHMMALLNWAQAMPGDVSTFPRVAK